MTSVQTRLETPPAPRCIRTYGKPFAPKIPAFYDGAGPYADRLTRATRRINGPVEAPHARVWSA